MMRITNAMDAVIIFADFIQIAIQLDGFYTIFAAGALMNGRI
jgi:hypothetical protein